MLDRRALLRIAIGGTAAMALLVAVANVVVLAGARGTTSDPAAEPHAQVALVLGAGLDQDGSPSAMLEDRIRAAVALYRDGRVDRILASGDHGRAGYDEPNAMRHELVRLGVPDEDVFTDHAGFA